MNRRLAIAIYLASAAVLGAVVAIPHLSPIAAFGAIVVVLFGATMFRMLVLREPNWSRHEIEWIVTFGAVWVALLAIAQLIPA